jgi:hypothetical protein
LFKSASCDCAPNELALDDERSRFTTPRKEVRFPDWLELRDALLLLRLEVVGNESSPLEVDGRESESSAAFFLQDIERLIQDGESRSFDGVESVDMMSSDIWRIRKAAGAWAFYKCV